MFLSVLTNKNLVSFNFIMGFTEKSDFFQGGGSTQTKSGLWGMEVVAVFRFKREDCLVKKEGVFSLLHFGRQGVCHDITKSADSQTNINFSENDCIIAEILQKNVHQMNDQESI